MCKKNKEEINKEDITRYYYEMAKKYEKLEKDMQLLLYLEPIRSASSLFSCRERTDYCDMVTTVYIIYVRYGKLETCAIFTNREHKPIEYKAVEEDINFAVVELVIGANDAKEIVYLLVDKQNKTVSDITRWYKNEEKK